MKTVVCKAPYGKGGMGAHVAQIIEETRAQELLACYYCSGIRPGDEHIGHAVRSRLSEPLLRYTPVRFSPSWRHFLANDLFDRAVASMLHETTPVYAGFAGQFLRSARRAQSLGAQGLELHVATAHVRATRRKYASATKRYGIEGSWLGQAMIRKVVKEYEMADVIYVNSEYTRQSFLEEGVSDRKLRRTHLRPHPRFQPAPSRSEDGIFRVVYVGGITVTKGIPVLLEAFSRLSARKAELVLVGGWATRGMRRYIQAWMSRDRRIRIVSGDPLPHLQAADVYVHPTYQDGFGYAPLEALRCGVPVIVTEDTGMKEHVREGENGFTVPTGSWEAILNRLEYIHSHGLPYDPLASEIDVPSSAGPW